MTENKDFVFGAV